MVIKLSGGKVYDPANKVSGEVRDIYVEDGKIVGARTLLVHGAVLDRRSKCRRRGRSGIREAHDPVVVG